MKLALRLVIGDAAPRAGERVVELGERGAGHAASCACCRPVSAVVTALRRLAIDHARGTQAVTGAVVAVASAAEADEVGAELRRDALVAARFEFAP